MEAYNLALKKGLTLSEIMILLNGNVIWADKELLELQIERAGAADIMSDILAFTKSGSLILTGLINEQSVRTAFITEVRAIVYVRGKKPTPDAIELAREKRIPLFSTGYHMYEACGILYLNGIIGNTNDEWENNNDEQKQSI